LPGATRNTMCRPSICGGSDESSVSREILALLSAFAAVALWFAWRWFTVEHRRRAQPAAIDSSHADPQAATHWPRPTDSLIGLRPWG
jgi:hypothetical protein